MKMLMFIFAALAACFSSPAAAARQDFVLVNNTGYPIEQVYVSASAKEEWEEDVLGRDVLPAGGRTTIHFPKREDACLWDLKVVYTDGETAEWQALNLCTISVVALSYDRNTGDTWAETE
jgi:hypothetical protein